MGRYASGHLLAQGQLLSWLLLGGDWVEGSVLHLLTCMGMLCSAGDKEDTLVTVLGLSPWAGLNPMEGGSTERALSLKPSHKMSQGGFLGRGRQAQSELTTVGSPGLLVSRNRRVLAEEGVLVDSDPAVCMQG